MKKAIINGLLTIALVMMLTGCTWPWNTKTPEPIDVSYTPVQPPELVVPDVDEIEGREVEWILVTRENAEEVFDRLDASGRSVVLFAISDSGYENLSLNLQDILTLVQQQDAVISAYRRYYEESQREIDATNRENREKNNNINQGLPEEP